MSERRTAAEALDEMAATYRERNLVYRDNFIRIGDTMHALFPAGLKIDTPADWVRLYFFMLGIAKKSRYATNWQTGGHKDSIHDSGVYAAMLEVFDDQLREDQINAEKEQREVDRRIGNHQARNGKSVSAIRRRKRRVGAKKRR